MKEIDKSLIIMLLIVIGVFIIIGINIVNNSDDSQNEVEEVSSRIEGLTYEGDLSVNSDIDNRDENIVGNEMLNLESNTIENKNNLTYEEDDEYKKEVLRIIIRTFIDTTKGILAGEASGVEVFGYIIAWTGAFCFLGPFIISMFIIHIIKSIAVYIIAKNDEHSGWQAWLPILYYYKLGDVAYKDNYMKWIMFFLRLIMFIPAFRSGLISNILTFLIFVTIIISLYNIFKRKSNKAVYMIGTILIFNILIAVIFGRDILILIPDILWLIIPDFIWIIGAFMLLAISGKKE